MSDTELTPPPPPSVKPTPTSSDGDWTCSDCSNVNFSWRNSCNRCAKARTPTFQKKKKLGQEIGKQAAEKSRGLFSADDWQCNKCGNVNWARRQACNVCNAPKFGEVEERTGFGGGYNDRGVVEYKEREDSSDDEYDEFGRKKKKRDNGFMSSSTTTTTTPTTPVTPHKDIKTIHKEKETEKVVETDKDEEEEDDEEEDDDGDLSKYDLSDWGDADGDGGQNNANETRNSHKSRRTRSRSRSRSRSPLSKH